MELTDITINNRYKLMKKISEGAFSDYYEAIQTDIGASKVVVRIINDSRYIASDEEIIKIRHDLRVVSQLNHRNILKILEFGEVFKLPYIVMEYAPGKRLYSYLKSNDITLVQAIDIITQITRGLVALHQSGVIHRGLNPDRIHICSSESSNDITVKLKDIYYPHIRDLREQESSQDDSPDFFEFFSPEQLNLKNDTVDHRSDLYSLGVLFYRLATGRYPYSTYQLLIAMHSDVPPVPDRPVKFNSCIDSTIEAIILKLLSIVRDARYSSASALLSDLEKYSRGERDFPPEISTYGFRQDFRIEMIGRKKEYERLIELYEYTVKDHGSLCLIRGEPGTGKTRLVRDFLSSPLIENMVYISGRCTRGVNKEPFELIKGFLNSYIEVFNGYSDRRKDEIRRALKGSLGMLGGIILKLNRNITQVIGDFPEPVPINPEYESKRFQSVVGDFFQKLAAIEKPLIITADDIQWIDDGSLELVENICSGIENTSMFFIILYNGDDLQAKPFTQRFIRNIESAERDYNEINLKVLDKKDTGHMISSILYNCENIIEKLTGFIHNKGGGNPLFTIEILRGLIDEKILRYTPAGWEIDSHRLELIHIPHSISDFMIKKISLLNARELQVLSHASLIGHIFEFSLLSSLFDEPFRDELPSLLENCSDLQFIHRDEQKKNLYHFVHDSVRAVLSAYISEHDKQVIHQKIAANLEAAYSGRTYEVIFDIANHYIECDNYNKILQYALPAADIASGSFANQDAARYYQIIIDILKHEIQDGNYTNLKQWAHAKNGLAGIYLRTGHYDDTINILNELIPYINNPVDRIFPYSMLSNAYFKKGDLRLCEVFAKIGIEEIGGKLPADKKSLIFSLIKEIIDHTIHSLTPSFLTNKRNSENYTSQQRVLILYESLSFLYAIKNRYKYIWVTLKILNIVESNPGEEETEIKALSSYGLMMSVIGFFKIGSKYLDRALDVSVKINNPHHLAVSSMYLGNIYEWQGKFDKALVYYNNSMKFFEQIGNSNGIGFVLNALSSCYLNLADMDTLSAIIDRYHDISTSVQNNYMICNSLIYRATYYITKGNFDMAMIHTHKAYTVSADLGILMVQCISSYLIGTVYYYKNELDKAINYYETSILLYEKNGFIKYYTCHSYPLLVEVLVTSYLNTPASDEASRQRLLVRIKKLIDIAFRSSKGWPTVQHYTNVAAARYYAAIGNNSKAEKYFLKSIDLTSIMGMKFEGARTNYEYGLFLINTGNSLKGKRELEFSYSIFKEIGSEFYITKTRKLLGLKSEGKSSHKIKQIVYKKKLELMDTLILDISQITENDRIFTEFIRNAAFIAGVYYGILYIFNDDNCPDIVSSYGKYEFETPELYNAASAVFNNGESRTVDNDGAASFLFLPVKHQGRTIAVCAFGSESMNSSFTDEDEKLLSTFVSRISWLLNFVLEQFRSNQRDDESRIKVSNANEEKIKKVISYINENYMFDISREGLAALIDSNPDYFGRSFKLYTGMKISEYINKVRVEEAAKRLTNTDNKIIDIALAVGFENLGTFNNSFLKIMKIIPSKYRKQNLKLSTAELTSAEKSAEIFNDNQIF